MKLFTSDGGRLSNSRSLNLPHVILIILRYWESEHCVNSSVTVTGSKKERNGDLLDLICTEETVVRNEMMKPKLNNTQRNIIKLPTLFQ